MSKKVKQEAEVKTVTIGDGVYDISKLTDNALALIADISKIDGEIGRLNLSLSIANVAKNSLIEKLIVEKENLGDAKVSDVKASE